MTKGYLTIDIPDNCKSCPLFVDIKTDDAFYSYCSKTHTYVSLPWHMAYWCPIKSMPEKMSATATGIIGYVQGWNKCIEEITGETE